MKMYEMNWKTLIKLIVPSVILTSVLTATVVAQSAPPPPAHDTFFMGGPGGMMGGGFDDNKTVTGAPLTAVIVTTRDTTLADGNTIHHESQSTIYRDSEGRVRREVGIDLATPATGNVKRNFITINDPVAGKRYMLNPDNKTAHLMPPRGAHHANRVGDPNANLAPGPAGPGGPGGPGEVTNEPLDPKNVNDVQAAALLARFAPVEGVRVTRTIPQGAIGNANPIVVVTERWYSPDLQMVVLTTHTDPMMGTVTAKLTSVVRGDPDPMGKLGLFQIPSDYKVETGKPNGPPFSPKP
jgi:hypothetical protein